jgi:hypothetical protein
MSWRGWSLGDFLKACPFAFCDACGAGEYGDMRRVGKRKLCSACSGAPRGAA